MADGEQGCGIDRCQRWWTADGAVARAAGDRDSAAPVDLACPAAAPQRCGGSGRAVPLSEGCGGPGRDWLRRRLLGGLIPPETRPPGIEGNASLVAGREASCSCPDPGIWVTGGCCRDAWAAG
ncbi:hypothetical protein NDU88_007997 [Pleurodeles waltl]|uniref:Uncharacterized protein n=1 Tax=Pleurodeles waltl TaxID=8319 RepID=A0AAV7PN91_PLEWA|nr:hypothetical protein NDU88_007997 [Pleurodeles waltl]